MIKIVTDYYEYSEEGKQGKSKLIPLNPNLVAGSDKELNAIRNNLKKETGKEVFLVTTDTSKSGEK